MADTTAATEAKKLKKELTDQFGEFIPDGTDPATLYKQWVSALFPVKDENTLAGDPTREEPDNELLFQALTMAKLANIDVRSGLLYIKDGKVIINIDGLVAIADQTGQYGGTSKVDYHFDENKKVESVTVGIYKVIGEHVLTPEQVVYMDEYDTGEGLWLDAKEGGKKRSMLKKVGLAHAIRASFTVCAGLYIPEEVGHGRKPKADAEKKKTEMQTNIEKALAKNRKKGKSSIEDTKVKKAK
jgi:hypothetical protein